MYQPETKWDARKYEFKELIANDVRLTAFMKGLRTKHRTAFDDILKKLDADWDERVTTAQAEIASPSADLDEGELEPTEGEDL